MNIQILDSWLREHLSTNAKPQQLADSLSLCGPSFEKVDKVKIDGKIDYLYDIEVTTNRVDMMSVQGIAREASVILPEFGYRAKLKPNVFKKPQVTANLPIKLKVDLKLSSRVMGVVLEIDSIDQSPEWLKQRLVSSGIRSLNLPVDITNYVMLEVGHPIHVFDYDLVKPQMSLRTARAGEKVVSLENKEYDLEKDDIVIDNGKGEIIDLPGIIGTKNSIVHKNTKRILYFLETNDPVHIRKTSIRLGIRTNAAVLNEKGVDPYLAEIAMYRGIDLFRKYAKARVKSKVYDSFKFKPAPKTISVSHTFIEKILGVQLKKSKVVSILKALGFSVKLSEDTYLVQSPTFRFKDIDISEDVVEEIARIYGYHKLPSRLMSGAIPNQVLESSFDFENEAKRLLVGMGANEVYTNSLVSQSMTSKGSLEIANPLGKDTSHLRKSLRSSLIRGANVNKNIESFHLFEIANVYLPTTKLPDEVMMLAGVIKGQSYRKAKGVIEALFSKLRIVADFSQVDNAVFQKNHRVQVKGLGEFGVLKNNYFYYQFEIDKLKKNQTPPRYIPIPKYPSQIEDITFRFPKYQHVVSVINTLSKTDPKIVSVDLVDKYKNYFTFRIHYQDTKNTLDNKHVEKLRNKLIGKAKSIGLSVRA
ncbi:phenylalanine--tRNA ligase subunit beta [Patescibacteria group bacterium]